MSIIKKVTLTINKNNAGVKLSSPLRFYKNDSLLLQFEIEQWNFETKKNEIAKPLYAVAFIETPNETDMIECTVLDGQIVQLYLLPKHTALVGQGRMQIIVRDSHGEEDETCQIATPPFFYDVEELINDSQILVDENGNVVVTEEAKPIVGNNGFTTIDELEGLEAMSGEEYMLIVKENKLYKVKSSILNNSSNTGNVEELRQQLEELKQQLEELKQQLSE